MKNKIYYLATKLIVALVFIAILVIKSTASEAPKLKMVQHYDERAIVVIDNSDNIVSELTVENSNGDILYYREGRINNSFYSKVFDFKNLSNGSYKIVVKNKFGKQEAPFSVNNNQIVIKENTPSIKPYFDLTGDLLKLSALNYSQNSLFFSIRNSDGEIFKKALGNDFNITTGFNIGKLTKGDYTANISDGFNTYSYTFER
jgi:hypothetical protein